MMPLSCFLFALYPILFLWSRNWEEVFFPEVSFLIGLALASTAAIHLVFKLIFPTSQKATIATLLYLVMLVSFDHFFYFYSPVFQFLYKKKLFGITIGRYAVLLPAWAILFLCVLFLLYKTKRNLSALPQFFTAISLILVISTLPPLASNVFIPKYSSSEQTLNVSTMLARGTSTVGYLPNIYYIILDEYTRNDVLKDVYDFDNSTFTGALEKHGFFIADKSCSNYAMTELSLPSFFTSTFHNSTAHFSPNACLNQSNVIKFLKNQGYVFINVSWGCGYTDHSELSDREPLRNKWFGRFAHLCTNKTFFGPFLELYKIHKAVSPSFARVILQQLKTLKNLSHEEEKPFIAFCHIQCPHVPFVFDKDGSIRKVDAIPGDEYFESFAKRKKAYVDQIKGLNIHVLKAIKEILANETNKPIIIIHSDHGSKHSDPYRCINNMGKPTPTILKDRMSILNTYYFPHGGNQKLYSTITPVNTFRVLCNHYFDTKLGLLPDTVHWSVYADLFSWTKYTPDQINEMSFHEIVS